MNEKYFVLFANCIPVSGAKNYIICDLFLNRYITVPEFIYYIFTKLKTKSLFQIKKYFNNKVDDELNFFVEKLLRDNWGIYTDNVKQFPEISFDYISPTKLNNAIFDFDQNSTYDIAKAILKVDELGCQAIQIRFFNIIEFSFIINLLLEINYTQINYIEIVLKKEFCTSFDDYIQLFKSNLRLKKIFLHNQLSNETQSIEDDFVNFGIIYKIKSDFFNEESCGKIKKENFLSQITFFSESLAFNTCLNKKIAVDKNGLVKNCPSMKQNFGKIATISLSEITNNKMFYKYWDINKDKIEVCKDCEFRYICMDCRAYIKDPLNIYSKPAKCDYDPYVCNLNSIII